MTNLISNYVAVSSICTVALSILVQATWHNVLFVDKMKKQFSFAPLITMVVIVAELVSVVFENMSSVRRTPTLIANTIGFSLSPFIAIALAKAFFVGEKKTKSLLTIPIWINFFLVIGSPWTGFIFNINANASYLRGPLFGVFVAAYLCSYIILVIDSVKAMNYYQCHTKNTFIMLLVFTVIGTTVQLIFPHVHISWLCVTLSLILFYSYFCVLTETQDTLTGLLNRNVYDQYTNNLHHKISGIVIVFDLDGFKQINDKYGHHWGDICLKMIGSLIKDCFCGSGFCYRIGGDEFCVICKNADEQLAEEMLRSFHHKIDEIRKSKNLQHELPMVSTGYASFHGSAKEFYKAVINADKLMYCYKNDRKQKQNIKSIHY